MTELAPTLAYSARISVPSYAEFESPPPSLSEKAESTTHTLTMAMLNPVEFHIYKSSLLSKDEIIKNNDKILYNLTSSKSIFSTFSITLTAPNSPTSAIFKITKANYGFSATDLKLTFPSSTASPPSSPPSLHREEFISILFTTGKMSNSRSFHHPLLGKFYWLAQSTLAGEKLICIEGLQGEGGRVIGEWERKGFSLLKSGIFRIIPEFGGNEFGGRERMEVLLGTALVVEEWRREQACFFKAD